MMDTICIIEIRARENGPADTGVSRDWEEYDGIVYDSKRAASVVAYGNQSSRFEYRAVEYKRVNPEGA